jgi:hypothetical protein
MKKIAVLCACFALLYVSQAQAAPKKRVVETQASIAAREAALMEAEGKAQTLLQAKAWTVNIMPRNKKAKAFTDVLTFKDGTLSSGFFSARGFNASNYALSIKPDGMAVVETVQSNAEGEYASWRGELIGETLQGMISVKAKLGREIYDFLMVPPVTAVSVQQ